MCVLVCTCIEILNFITQTLLNIKYNTLTVIFNNSFFYQQMLLGEEINQEAISYTRKGHMNLIGIYRAEYRVSLSSCGDMNENAPLRLECSNP